MKTTNKMHHRIQTSLFSTCIVITLALAMFPSAAQAEEHPLKVFVFAGTSNLGSGTVSELPNDLKQPQKDVLVWQGNAWVPLDPGKAPLQGNGGSFGPQVTFGQVMSKYFGQTIGIIMTGLGAVDDHKGYDRIVKTVQEARKSRPIVIAGLLIQAGERDGWTEERAHAFQQNLTGLMESARRDFGNPAMLGSINLVIMGASTFGKIIRNTETTFDMPGFRAIDCDDLPRIDGIHYTSTGQMEFGKRFAGAMIDLMKGVSQVAMPTITPPGGAGSDTVTITLNCATPGARIMYTAEYHDANKTQHLYSAPFTLHGDRFVVGARAYKDGMSDSFGNSAAFNANPPKAPAGTAQAGKGAGEASPPNAVIYDTFAGDQLAPIAGRTPDKADAPGGKWIKIGDGSPVIANEPPRPSAGDLICGRKQSAAIAFPLTSQGAYKKASEFNISADIRTSLEGHPVLGLGFYAKLPEPGEPIEHHFTGLCLDTASRDLILYQDGTPANSVKYTGPQQAGDYTYTLSYDVDSVTGEISNVRLSGSTSDYSAFKTAAFKDAATAYAGFVTFPSAGVGKGLIRNFKIITNPTPSPHALDAPASAPVAK
ncbi:MAG: sialate O-acetylesterase [Lentisphaeria bacterium]|jgi:hypothetical protein